MRQKRIAVIGGGFGGFITVRSLLKRGFDVTLISENNYFYFTPLLVEVVTRTLTFDDVSLKINGFFKNKNFKFVLGKAEKINFEKNEITVGKKIIQYDFAVIATGSRRRDLPMPGHEKTLPLKNLEDAVVLRKTLFDKLSSHKGVLHVSVIGAGASGIELAFAVNQLARHLKTHPKIEVNVFDTGSSILPGWKAPVRKYVIKLMKKNKIKLHLEAFVEKVNQNSISTSRGEFHSDLSIVTVGVVPNTSWLDKRYLDEGQSIVVDQYLKVKGLENVFAVGDVSALENRQTPKLAQTAWDQGKLAAGNIFRLVKNKKLKPYHVDLLGKMLTLGSNKSVNIVKGFVFTGAIGNLTRAATYIYKMPGVLEKMELAKSWLMHTLFKTNLKK